MKAPTAILLAGVFALLGAGAVAGVWYATSSGDQPEVVVTRVAETEPSFEATVAQEKERLEPVLKNLEWSCNEGADIGPCNAKLVTRLAAGRWQIRISDISDPSNSACFLVDLIAFEPTDVINTLPAGMKRVDEDC